MAGTGEAEPYLGFYINQRVWEDTYHTWCRTTAREDRGERAFSLTEGVHYDRRLFPNGWPTDPQELKTLLGRSGRGVVRALIALDAIPDGQTPRVLLQPQGPPTIEVDEDYLSRLILLGLQNFQKKYRLLREDRLDVWGCGELLWAPRHLTDYVRDRMQDRGLIRNMGMGVTDGFGSIRALGDGLTLLENHPVALPSEVRGFHFDSSQPASADIGTVEGIPIDPKKIFVVHGRDNGMKGAVARWLERVGLTPIILHERADQGRTIIEKFEGEAREAGFAVILASGDDEGRLRATRKMQLRARQNVILEMGFFIGVLGRSKVVTMLGEGVEIPSDYSGVIYVPFDSGDGWKLRLAKELRAARVPFDETQIVDA